MARGVTLDFTEFGWEAVTGCAASRSASLEDFVADACRHFLVELGSRRAALEIPEIASQAAGIQRELEITLPDEVWARLATEAERQSVNIETMLRHAALLLVADHESGHVAQRVVESSGELDDAGATPG